jgi:hypothetical protein
LPDKTPKKTDPEEPYSGIGFSQPSLM